MTGEYYQKNREERRYKQCKRSRYVRTTDGRQFLFEDELSWSVRLARSLSIRLLASSCSGAFQVTNINKTRASCRPIRRLDLSLYSRALIRVPVVAMSVSRAVLQSRFALSRAFASSRATSSILRLTSTAAPQRQFTLSARFQGEVIQTPATGPEAPLTATRDEGVRNGIVITKLSRHTTPNEIQQLLRDAGVEV